jgi:hypothetical protein
MIRWTLTVYERVAFLSPSLKTLEKEFEKERAALRVTANRAALSLSMCVRPLQAECSILLTSQKAARTTKKNEYISFGRKK